MVRRLSAIARAGPAPGLSLEEELDLENRAVEEDVAAVVRLAGSERGVEADLLMGLGDVADPEELIAAAEAEVVVEGEIQERAGLDQVADGGADAASARPENAVAALEAVLDVDEIHADGVLGIPADGHEGHDRLDGFGAD